VSRDGAVGAGLECLLQDVRVLPGLDYVAAALDFDLAAESLLHQLGGQTPKWKTAALGIDQRIQ
jgi:hypothetical protein